MTVNLLDAPECHAYLHVFGERAYVHLDIHRWSKTVLKRMLTIWPEMLKFIRSNGIKELCTYPENDQDARFAKFAKRFGFKFMRPANGHMVYAHEGN